MIIAVEGWLLTASASETPRIYSSAINKHLLHRHTITKKDINFFVIVFKCALIVNIKYSTI